MEAVVSDLRKAAEHLLGPALLAMINGDPESGEPPMSDDDALTVHNGTTQMLITVKDFRDLLAAVKS